MENLHFKEEDKDKMFSACTYRGEQVVGELFHVNGNHFLLVNGTFAVKVVPQTIKEYSPEVEQKDVADEVRGITKESKDKLVEDFYNRILGEIKSRAKQGYTCAVTQVPDLVASSVTGLLANAGFDCKVRFDSTQDQDLRTIKVNW